MEITWVVCPNLRGARLFECRALEEGVKFVREFKRPDVQLREADFDTDEDLPEVLTDVEREKRELEIAESYSKFLGQELDQARRNKEYKALVLCAEHRLLGILKKNLTPEVKKLLYGVVEQDLYNINESDLVNYLRDLPGPAASKKHKSAA